MLKKKRFPAGTAVPVIAAVAAVAAASVCKKTRLKSKTASRKNDLHYQIIFQTWNLSRPDRRRGNNQKKTSG